jgi:hypothetical protein
VSIGAAVDADTFDAAFAVAVVADVLAIFLAAGAGSGLGRLVAVIAAGMLAVAMAALDELIAA